jgi:tRNA(fMet)-specific endonuclease VapC
MILLDTNIVIHLFNGDRIVTQHLNTYAPQEIGISFITAGELIFGAMKSHKKSDNLLKISRFCAQINVLHSNDAMASLFGELKALSSLGGKFPGDHDLWIAATALKNRIPLITKNLRHFRWIENLQLEDWNS